MTTEIILPKRKCLRCGHSWIPRKSEKPKYCAKCNNRYWDRPRQDRINVGEKNGMWKGDKVKYNALHDYIKYNLPEPNNCQDCDKNKRLDLANINGKYKRDLSDWEWLCRSCHMIKDERLNKLHKNNIGKTYCKRQIKYKVL